MAANDTFDEKQGLPILPFASQRHWEDWPDQHHQSSKGLWLKIAKRGAGVDTVTYDQALETALRFGWIDGQKAALDDTHWLQRFTPRGPRSKWSKINRDKVTQLIAANAMRPAGLAAVEQAKRNGAWEQAYDGQSR